LSTNNTDHPIQVEANTAFDVLTAQPQIEKLKTDTDKLVNIGRSTCFSPDG
jgi:hypothetical protein